MTKPMYIYFITNWTNEVIYTGVTNNLQRRVYEHKYKIIKGFSNSYKLSKLVYYEVFDDAENAILREKQIKKWRRDKKDVLVNKMNPDWEDLYETL
jgi:putative endonuclease